MQTSKLLPLAAILTTIPLTSCCVPMIEQPMAPPCMTGGMPMIPMGPMGEPCGPAWSTPQYRDQLNTVATWGPSQGCYNPNIRYGGLR